MDQDILRSEARRTRGCRCCGWLLVVGLLAVGLLIWGDYLNTLRLAVTLDTQELSSTEQVEQYLAEHDIKVKHEEGEWKADPPWKQALVDRLRERFDELAGEERLAGLQQQAEDSRDYIRELLARTPEEIQPHLDELKQQFALLADSETVRSATETLSEMDRAWLEEEAGRLLDSQPGENLALYIDRLRAMLDNVQDEDLRERLRSAIDRQLGEQQEQSLRGELPEILPRTGEVPLVSAYMREQGEQREPQSWGFVREPELEDGPAYSVVVTFTDGSRTIYYIRDGVVLRGEPAGEDQR
ncbi:hypothetical protein KDL44_08260 [bacterium]|nr:hypothetical protein [bacterium]